MVCGVTGVISLRLSEDTLRKLDELSTREGKDRSTLIRELLEKGIKEKNLDNAVELYRRGEATGWRTAQSAGVSLWNFLRVLDERGVLLQYGERDLERDLSALREG